MSRNRKLLIVLWMFVAAGIAVALAVYHSRTTPPVTLQGAVLVRSNDVDKELPIPDVRISVARDLVLRTVESSATGFFELTLSKRVMLGQAVILQFRHPQYMPLDITVLAGDRLKVARMVPIPEPNLASVGLPQIQVSNIKIRYTVKISSLLNVGSAVKTFRVVNTGNVPCNNAYPCSPDGKWKATIGSANLDAPNGDVFSDARVSCIAGPCPFTKLRSDGFSRGGPEIHAAFIDWSDTTTFLFEAEVFRYMVSDDVRISYPVIFGQTLHFSVPANAEGVCIEADVNHDSIVFPIGPLPLLSWASCTESVSANRARVYQCGLMPGYTFK